MRLSLSLLIIALTACSQSGIKNGSRSLSTTDTGSNTSTISVGDGDTASPCGPVGISDKKISFASMRYNYPFYPAKKSFTNCKPSTGTAGQLNPKRFYIASVADATVGSGANAKNPKEEQASAEGASTDAGIKEYGVKLYSGGGSNFCFSNDDYVVNNVNVFSTTCQRAAPALGDMISQLTADGERRHPVLISAIKFNFRSVPKSGNTTYSEAIIDSIYVEKAPIVFIKEGDSKGQLAPITDQYLTKITYGSGGCNLSDQNAVGFDSVNNYMGSEYYLSGIWSLERSERQIFSEGTVAQQPRFCDDSGGAGTFYCNLFADNVQVFHSFIVPVVYTNNKLSYRQYENETIQTVNASTQCMVNGVPQAPGLYPNGTRCLAGVPDAVPQSFGRYAGDGSKSYVSTPSIGQDPGVGFTTAQAALLAQTWKTSYITKLCFKGHRVETDAFGNETTLPLISVMRAELRSPHMVLTFQ